MSENVKSSVWVFHGANGRFSGGIFSDILQAEAWILKYNLTGVLTKYPVNESAYDWAINNNFFEITTDDQTKPLFIQKFTSANQEHFHYEDGRRDN